MCACTRTNVCVATAVYKAQELGICGKLSFSASEDPSVSSSSAPASGAMREAFGTAQGEVCKSGEGRWG